MRKLTKFGGVVLSLALTATLLAPMKASAYQEHDFSTSSGSVIDVNENQIMITGVDTSDTVNGYSSSKAALNAWNNAVAQGIAVPGTYQKYDKSLEVYNDTTGKYDEYYFLYASRNYSTYNSSTEVSDDKKSVTYILTFKYTEYVNNITGEKSYNRTNLTGESVVEGPNSIPTKRMVYVGGYSDIYVGLDAGNVQIKNLKSSKKSVVKARAIAESVETTSDYYQISKDAYGYYYTSNTSGEKVYVPTSDTKVSKSGATYSIRVFGKKEGKSVISFDIYNESNVKTGSAKITVVSTKQAPIDSITFAGKSLEQGDEVGTANSNYIYKGKNVNSFYGYTTKKSGKLKVIPNKDYKLVRIQVGTLEKYHWDNTQDPAYGYTNYTTPDATSVDTVSIDTTQSHPVDLNGDGDYDDSFAGVSERSVTYRYKTVKNGKNIKLSKTPSYTNRTTNKSKSYAGTNASENTYNNTVTNQSGFSNKAPTRIKVTLYSRVSKSYIDVYYTIYKRIRQF